jgi:large subunit ribosomal protein L39
MALVDGAPWDMHRPLEKSCELKFEHFKDENPQHSNKVFEI